MSVPELRSEVMLRNEETGGHVSVIENVVAPRAKGPYLHTHDFDETFYMLEGELVFQLEDQLMTKRRGEVAFAPPPACRRGRSVRGRRCGSSTCAGRRPRAPVRPYGRRAGW